MTPYLITSYRPARNSRREQRRQRVGIDHHQRRRMEGADQVLAARRGSRRPCRQWRCRPAPSRSWARARAARRAGRWPPRTPPCRRPRRRPPRRSWSRGRRAPRAERRRVATRSRASSRARRRPRESAARRRTRAPCAAQTRRLDTTTCAGADAGAGRAPRASRVRAPRETTTPYVPAPAWTSMMEVEGVMDSLRPGAADADGRIHPVHDSADFLIIGSGVAGLRAAASLAQHGSVLVLTKATEPSESNTGYAQGGIAAAVGDDDSPALHARDTEAAGDGLCAPDAVRVLVDDGPAYVRELAEWGAAIRPRRPRPVLARPRGRAQRAPRAPRARCHRPRDQPRAVGTGVGAAVGARGRRRSCRDAACRARRVCGRALSARADGGRRARLGDAAGDRRRRPRLPRDHESSGGDRRRRGAGVAGRRRGGRPRVRAVPSRR